MKPIVIRMTIQDERAAAVTGEDILQVRVVVPEEQAGGDQFYLIKFYAEEALKQMLEMHKQTLTTGEPVPPLTV